MDFASLRAFKARYALMLSLLSGLYFFQQAAVAAAPVDADEALGLCQIDTLPQDIRGTLERRFSGWKIQEASNLLPKARQKWAAIAPLACPGIATGHFEDRHSISYALLLVPADSSANGYKFVVFTPPSGQSYYGFKMLDQSAANASSYFIHTVAVDRIFDRDLKKRFRPKSGDAVLLSAGADQLLSQNAFFWTGESYDHAQIDYQ